MTQGEDATVVFVYMQTSSELQKVPLKSGTRSESHQFSKSLKVKLDISIAAVKASSFSTWTAVPTLSLGYNVALPRHKPAQDAAPVTHNEQDRH